MNGTIVVTNEQPRPESRNRVLLPDVCVQFNVPYKDTLPCSESLVSSSSFPPHVTGEATPMFKAMIGDLFASEAQTLVNAVNCVGVMGKGVALEFKRRWPKMFEDYALRCERKQVRLGEPYLCGVDGCRVINFPTKGHWRSSSRIADIENGLDYLVAHANEWEITSLALPQLGCGNGGLDWADVGPLIYRKLHGLRFDVTVYASCSTPAHQLSQRFLEMPARSRGNVHQKGAESLT